MAVPPRVRPQLGPAARIDVIRVAEGIDISFPRVPLAHARRNASVLVCTNT